MMDSRDYVKLWMFVVVVVVGIVLVYGVGIRKPKPQEAPLDPRIAELSQRLDNVERGMGFMEYRLKGHDSAVSSHEERLGRLEKKR